MKTWLRSSLGLLVGLTLALSLVLPARADPKRDLLVEKVQTRVTIATLTLKSHVAEIVENQPSLPAKP
jgi:hypothetical protein